MATVKITQEQFDKLAKAASEEDCFRGRKTKHGMEYGIFVNKHLMAKSSPNKDGEYDCVMYM